MAFRPSLRYRYADFEAQSGPFHTRRFQALQKLPARGPLTVPICTIRCQSFHDSPPGPSPTCRFFGRSCCNCGRGADPAREMLFQLGVGERFAIVSGMRKLSARLSEAGQSTTRNPFVPWPLWPVFGSCADPRCFIARLRSTLSAGAILSRLWSVGHPDDVRRQPHVCTHETACAGDAPAQRPVDSCDCLPAMPPECPAAGRAAPPPSPRTRLRRVTRARPRRSWRSHPSRFCAVRTNGHHFLFSRSWSTSAGWRISRPTRCRASTTG